MCDYFLYKVNCAWDIDRHTANKQKKGWGELKKAEKVYRAKGGSFRGRERRTQRQFTPRASMSREVVTVDVNIST